MFFTCIAKDDMMLYFVILGYGIQREAKFANMSFSNDIGREWPMPLPARGTDVWMFPFDEMADDGIIMMERFLATLGLTNVDVGRTFHVPLTMVVNKKTRNEDLMRTRMSWLVLDNMPSGTQCVISMPKMIEQISFEFFVQADLLRCDECFFASFKLKITDNIWADHSGNFFYGLELQEDGRHGKTVTAKKLCGDKDRQTKIWRYRDAPTVPAGFKGLGTGEVLLAVGRILSCVRGRHAHARRCWWPHLPFVHALATTLVVELCVVRRHRRL